MSKLVPKLVPFKAGQTWSHKWHYDWASFGELPPQYDKIYIVKRTAKMVAYQRNGGPIKRAKIQSWPKGHQHYVKGNEYFKKEIVGYYRNEHMKLL